MFKVLSSNAERKEFTAEVYFILPSGKAFVDADEGSIVNIFFSQLSAEAASKYQKIYNRSKTSKNLTRVFDTLTCITDITSVRLCSAKAPSGGIVILNVQIRDTNSNSYIKTVDQILSTFKFTQ